MAVKYFLYSDEQIEEKNNVLAQTGRKFVPGVVSVGSSKIKFTQLSDKPTIDRFVDTKIVASGELSDFSYTLPSSESKRGD
jgi:hypothetical protein